MKNVLRFLVLIIFALSGTMENALSQEITNTFFPLHNIIRGDSVYNTFDKQVALIKSAGFDAIEINQLDSFEGMKAALDKHQFQGAYFYVKLNADEAYMDPRLKEYIARLRGTNVVIAPFVTSDTRKLKAPVKEVDDHVMALVKQIGQWSADAGLQVAFYPHYGFYVETHGHALDLAKKINMKNVGVSFNLCHWLATTNAEQRKSLETDLQAWSPYLKLVTICGANDVITTKKSPWEDYILPLGSGDFDTYNLVRNIVQKLGYKGPIGVQCYDIKGSKPELVTHTIAVWHQYKQRLQNDR